MLLYKGTALPSLCIPQFQTDVSDIKSSKKSTMFKQLNEPLHDCLLSWTKKKKFYKIRINVNLVDSF